MKSIVVFGAGKSATCLIDYLIRVCGENQWTLTIGDADADALKKKGIKSPVVNSVQVNVENSRERNSLIRQSDLVISLLPPALHILIARDCVANAKNLLTASYVDDEIRKLHSGIRRKKSAFYMRDGT